MQSLSWLSISALATSVLALILSFSTFYNQYLKPFELHVMHGHRTVFGFAPFVKGGPPVSMVVDVLCANGTPAGGWVKDIALEVGTPTGDRRVFVAAFTLPPEAPNVEYDPKTRVYFQSFYVGPKTSVAKRVGFVPLGISPVHFTEGVYNVTIKVMIERYVWWEQPDSKIQTVWVDRQYQVEFPQDGPALLAKGNIVAVGSLELKQGRHSLAAR